MPLKIPINIHGAQTYVYMYMTLTNSLQPPLQHRPAIRHNHRPINMPTRPTRQKYHQPRDILGPPQPQIRRELLQRLDPPSFLDQPAGHPGRVEPGRDGVGEDVSGAELDGQVLGQVDDGRFGGGVAEGGVLAQGADADARDGAGDDDPGGGVSSCVGGEQGGESCLPSVGSTFLSTLLCTCTCP